LPEDLEAKLSAEAEAGGRSRSDVVREAIAEYLARRERERFMAELAGEMAAGYAASEVRNEALELAEAGSEDGLDSILEAERAAGIDPAERWWK
jgi:metal-responsive CopG/Arc/MetJ family transcriptional regulator